MGKGLKFTEKEEREFKEMISFKPHGFSEWMGTKADRFANNIWTFFVLLAFCLISYFLLQPVLNQMLFISNTYQLIALPVLGIATGLSMMIILRFLFRILLEIRRMHKERQDEIAKLNSIVEALHIKHDELHHKISRMERQK